jgi:hypothetical protein
MKRRVHALLARHGCGAVAAAASARTVAVVYAQSVAAAVEQAGQACRCSPAWGSEVQPRASASARSSQFGDGSGDVLHEDGF